MLFEQRFWEPIARGEVTVTFRRWKRRQAIAGNRYRTAKAIIEADAVDIVTVDDITDADARAGWVRRRARPWSADLRGTPDLDLYRIRFHVVDEPDPRAVLAADAGARRRGPGRDRPPAGPARQGEPPRSLDA